MARRLTQQPAGVPVGFRPLPAQTPTSAKNANMNAAMMAQNDEFYTQWQDIEREVNAYLEYDPDVFRDKVVLLPCDDPEWSNFTKLFALRFTDLGLKKLISTSYAPDNNPAIPNYQPTLFESDDPKFDKKKTHANGKLFVLEREDINGDGVINIDDLQWSYLAGTGDFMSEEVLALRDEADIILTNPPFSLIKEFLAWLIDSGKHFSIIGPRGAALYKETFPLIRDNKMWLGRGFQSGNAYFGVADKVTYANGVYDPGTGLVKFRNCCWFTNIDHGRRHEPLQLMTMADNIRYSRRKEVKGVGYHHYYNFPDAIDVPYVEAIPSDFDGIMGVPSTFLDKYNPDQFEILASAEDMEQMEALGVDMLGEDFVKTYKANGGTGGVSPGHRKLGLTEPRYYWPFKRILIRQKVAS